MTEQDKAKIFDIVIKPFLRSDTNNESQSDAHLDCEQCERSTDRNEQRNGFKHRTVTTSTGKITLDVLHVSDSETSFLPLILGFEHGKRVD